MPDYQTAVIKCGFLQLTSIGADTDQMSVSANGRAFKLIKAQGQIFFGGKPVIRAHFGYSVRYGQLPLQPFGPTFNRALLGLPCISSGFVSLRCDQDSYH
jgi:hypothetical protein